MILLESVKIGMWTFIPTFLVITKV
jgi:hypothetical protein